MSSCLWYSEHEDDDKNTIYTNSGIQSILYGIGLMVKEHRGSQRGNLLPPLHGIENTFRIASREKERNVLFNDALNTFYLRLYGVRV